MPKLFRKHPPYELFQHILTNLRLQQNRWFSKEEIVLDTIDEWLPVLESYYIPCKAKRFLHENFDAHRCITILRHLAVVHPIEIQSQEKIVNGKKTTLYQIRSNLHIDLSGTQHDVLVEFN
jgi:hypothetical protein